MLNCETLGEYSDHYLKTDVLLLSDVFETFRDVMLKTHKLDPCNYLTLPGLSWDAMLRFTGVRLQLLTDYSMILAVERGGEGWDMPNFSSLHSSEQQLLV